MSIVKNNMTLNERATEYARNCAYQSSYEGYKRGFKDAMFNFDIDYLYHAEALWSKIPWYKRIFMNHTDRVKYIWNHWCD